MLRFAGFDLMFVLMVVWFDMLLVRVFVDFVCACFLLICYFVLFASGVLFWFLIYVFALVF